MKYIKPLAILLILLAVAGYFRRSPTEDDAWFAEESYWLLKDGKVKSEFFRGLLGWENNYLLSHKLFIVFGAVLQWLLPLSVYTSKLSGLVFFIILISLLIHYLKNQSIIHSQNEIWILFILVFSNTLLIKMSFENRPELMLTTLGFASFLSLYKQNRLIQTAFAGVFAGLAVLSHLNGLIFVLAGFTMLFWMKKYVDLFVFSLTALIVSSLYFCDIWYFGSFETWLYQFRNDPATQNAFGVVEKLKVMVTYPKLFFESPEQASLTLLLSVLFWSCRKYLYKLDKSLIVYALALFFGFWLLTKRASGVYQVLFIPTMFILIVNIYLNMSQYLQTKAVYFAIFLYLCVGIIGNVQIVQKNMSNYLPYQYANLSDKISTKRSGVVPLTFFFNEYSKYERLLCQTNFELQMKMKKKEANPIGFFEWAKANNAEFVVLNYANNNEGYYPIQGTKMMGDYKLKYLDKQYAVYLKK